MMMTHEHTNLKTFFTAAVDATAMYLRSVRSPVHQGRVKLRYKPYDKMEIFSQLPEEEDDDSYEHDSFCVENDHVEYDDSSPSVKARKKPASRKQNCKTDSKMPQKRKRIIQITDSSSEEEIKCLPSPKLEIHAQVGGATRVLNHVFEVSSADMTREQRLKLQKIKREEYLMRRGIVGRTNGNDTSSNDRAKCEKSDSASHSVEPHSNADVGAANRKCASNESNGLNVDPSITMKDSASVAQQSKVNIPSFFFPLHVIEINYNLFYIKCLI